MLLADLTPSATPFGNNPFLAPCRSLELEWPSAPAANCAAGSNPAFEARRMQEANATSSAHGSRRSCREEPQRIGMEVRGLDPGVFPTATPGVKEGVSRSPTCPLGDSPGKDAAPWPLERPAHWRGSRPGMACLSPQLGVVDGAGETRTRRPEPWETSASFSSLEKAKGTQRHWPCSS
jgi:hypothetical protein